VGVKRAVARSTREWLDRSAARFGQAHAVANARQASTRLLRQRVEREHVRLYLDDLNGTDDLHGTDGRERRVDGEGARRDYPGLP